MSEGRAGTMAISTPTIKSSIGIPASRRARVAALRAEDKDGDWDRAWIWTVINERGWIAVRMW